MIKPVLKMDERTGEKLLFMVPETELEEKFIIWFCHQHDLPRQRVNNRESLRLPGYNDPEEAERNLYAAFRQFKEKYRYTEIPDLSGMTVEAARREIHLRGLTWKVEREMPDHRFPPGTVISHQPPAGSAAVPDSVVRLVVSSG
jgi:hypothetical protein